MPSGSNANSMFYSNLKGFLRVAFAGLSLFTFSYAAFADVLTDQLNSVLPAKLGRFTKMGTVRPVSTLNEIVSSTKPSAADRVAVDTSYASDKGDQIDVQLVRLKRDVDAYSLLTEFAELIRKTSPGEGGIVQKGIGTASVSNQDGVAFFKGQFFGRVTSRNSKQSATLTSELATSLAEQIDKGEGDIPALVRHLPGGDQTQGNARFSSGLTSLSFSDLNQEVLTAISGQGDADAVLGSVGPSKVLIVEFNTPQLATENDKSIIAKIHDLWNRGLPAPTGYRRVGNYSVFIFDAPDEQTAKQLIDEVKYEQVVQWLGDNPYILKEAQKRYVETTMGVFVAVVKASGVALIGCLAAGGLFGGLLFLRRRKQQRAVEAFSDAGGMLRLNLDELSAQTDPSRLIQERN